MAGRQPRASHLQRCTHWALLRGPATRTWCTVFLPVAPALLRPPIVSHRLPPARRVVAWDDNGLPSRDLENGVEAVFCAASLNIEEANTARRVLVLITERLIKKTVTYPVK